MMSSRSACALGFALAVVLISGGKVHASFSAERADRAWVHSAVSYCKVSDDDAGFPPSVLDWDCEYCRRDNVDTFEILHSVSVSASDDTQVYVGVDRQLRECVVAFRGTQEVVPDMLTNVHIAYVSPYHLTHPAVEVHSGWRSAFTQVYYQNGLKTAVRSAIQANLCDTWLFTGHSLGGALATLAAVEFARDFPELQQVRVTACRPA
jgi:hypothetical protein